MTGFFSGSLPINCPVFFFYERRINGLVPASEWVSQQGMVSDCRWFIAGESHRESKYIDEIARSMDG